MSPLLIGINDEAPNGRRYYVVYQVATNKRSNPVPDISDAAWGRCRVRMIDDFSILWPFWAHSVCSLRKSSQAGDLERQIPRRRTAALSLWEFRDGF